MSAPGPVRRATNTRDDWETPPELFDKLDAEFGFIIDGAANPQNAKLAHWLGQQQDGSFRDAFAVGHTSYGERVWLNPPYGPGMPAWIDLIDKRWAPPGSPWTVVVLVPASTDSRWFHRMVRSAHEVRLLEGRVPFIHASHCPCKACEKGEAGSNTGASAIGVWYPKPRPPGQARIWVWNWSGRG